MEKGPENARVKIAVALLEKTSRKNKVRIWKCVAELLLMPARKKPEITLARLNKLTKEGEVVVTPAKILSNGSLGHAVRVGYFSASVPALKKLGANAVPLEQLIKENPSGKNVRLII